MNFSSYQICFITHETRTSYILVHFNILTWKLLLPTCITFVKIDVTFKLTSLYEIIYFLHFSGLCVINGNIHLTS